MLGPRAQKLVHVALGVAGVGAALAMLRYTDFRALRAFGPWAALVVLLEGLRVLAEALATRSLHGAAVRVPWYPLLRAHAAGYALAMTMPAGRSVAEAAKAVMLSRWVDAGRGVGVAATNQALVMAATGAVALVCALAARALGCGALAGAVAAQGAALVALGGGLLAMVRSRTIGGWVARRFPSAAARVEGAREGATTPGVPAAFACFAAHRAVQSAQIAALLGALGEGGALRSLALAGAAIVGTSVGVAVPGQLGAVGGAMALAAPGLGIAAPRALAVALVLHAAQFAWSALGLAVWAVTRPARGAR